MILVKITKDLTTVNYTKGNAGRKWIVIHYTGNNTDTAKANANYFKNVNRGASAHYFVDENSIYQVVSDDDTAWAVGRNYGHNNLFGQCTNANSISIEMCSTNGRIATKTLDNTVDLTVYLMKKYNIPSDHVVRHYDVCSKWCPGWSGWIPPDESIWKHFKSQIIAETKPATSGQIPPASTTSGKKTKGEIEMQCTFTIDGKSTVYWFDGSAIKQLSHADSLKIIKQIYKDNNGKDMPHYDWKSTAPWYIRLSQAISAKSKTFK